MQFQCNSSATRCNIFDLTRNLSPPHCDFCNEIGQNLTVPPLHSFFGELKWRKNKEAEKSKNEKVYWTVEEEEPLVELWPNYEYLYKTNSPEFNTLMKAVVATAAISYSFSSIFQ